MQNGYLVVFETVGAQAARMTDFAVSQTDTSTAFSASVRLVPPTIIAKSTADLSVFTGLNDISGFAQALPRSVDNFEGKHPLATTWMFLFDIVARMFVRKMPELANYLRD